MPSYFKFNMCKFFEKKKKKKKRKKKMKNRNNVNQDKT